MKPGVYATRGGSNETNSNAHCARHLKSHSDTRRVRSSRKARAGDDRICKKDGAQIWRRYPLPFYP
jgi:hypothetical protein